MVTSEDVWNKGESVPNNDPNLYRKDVCGAWIKYNLHGERETEYGWEIDHIKPESDGGSDHISNLRPLHWKNNLGKADGNLKCIVTSDGTNNKGWE